MPVELLDYPHADIRIVAHTMIEKMWRVKPMFKEPETVAWIDEYVQKDDVFYDIGANIGAYGFIAASRGAKVFAFEPEAMNFGRLVQNIGLNNNGENGLPPAGWDITAFPAALWDRHELLKMWCRVAEPGGAMHKLGTPEDPEKYPFQQDVLTIRLDDLDQWDIPIPTHMKIDVDGYEDRVCWGGIILLQSPELKTVMIEIDHSAEGLTKTITSAMQSALLYEKEHWHRSKETWNHLFVRRELLED